MADKPGFERNKKEEAEDGGRRPELHLSDVEFRNQHRAHNQCCQNERQNVPERPCARHCLRIARYDRRHRSKVFNKPRDLLPGQDPKRDRRDPIGRQQEHDRQISTAHCENKQGNRDITQGRQDEAPFHKGSHCQRHRQNDEPDMGCPVTGTERLFQVQDIQRPVKYK